MGRSRSGTLGDDILLWLFIVVIGLIVLITFTIATGLTIPPPSFTTCVERPSTWWPLCPQLA